MTANYTTLLTLDAHFAHLNSLNSRINLEDKDSFFNAQTVPISFYKIILELQNDPVYQANPVIRDDPVIPVEM